MATVEQCEQALHRFASTLAQKDPASRTKGFDRTLTCSIRDLNVIFAGRLHDGLLVDIARTTNPQAQIRMDLSSDDLLSMLDGSLHIASAWAKSRIKVSAGVRDMIKLRTIF